MAPPSGVKQATRRISPAAFSAAGRGLPCGLDIHVHSVNNNAVIARIGAERKGKPAWTGITCRAVACRKSAARPEITPMTTRKDLHQALGSLTPQALERMAYIVGSARGETSMSLHLIGAHPQLLAFPGPSHFINQVWRYRKVAHDRLLKVIYFANGFLDQRNAIAGLREGPREAATRLFNSAFADLDFRGLHDLYPLLYALAPERGAPPESYLGWLDKGNDANGIGDLAAHYPGAKFLFIVRDPRSAIATLTNVRAKKSAEPAVPGLRGALEESIYWRNLTQRCLRFAARHPDRTLIYAYERLVTDPHRVLGDIFAFLGLAALNVADLTGLIGDIGFGSNWGGGGSGLQTAPIVRWRQVLDDETVAMIARVCGPTARKLGYEIDRPERAPRALAQVSGSRAKAKAIAKLGYLALREKQTGTLDPDNAGRHLLWSPARQRDLEVALGASPAAA